MFIEASSPRKTGDKAKLVASVPSNGKKACLSFYYHLYGVAAGTLNVYSGSDKVFNISGNQGNYWIMVERNIRLDGSVSLKISLVSRRLYKSYCFVLALRFQLVTILSLLNFSLN